MNANKPGMTYASTGVVYEELDPFKRMAQAAARATAMNFSMGNYRRDRPNFTEVSESRGESVYLLKSAHNYWAHLEEGLGTKNLVADEMYRLTGRSYYDNIGQDTVAMIVNDMITLGARPLSLAMHLAVGDSSWFKDEQRSRDLINGWKHACNLAQCAWGCGETPALKGVVMPNAVVLSGSAMGVIEPKKRRIMGNIQDGDAIVFIESSGIHANGLTMARKIADELPDGYLTKLPNGRTYGDTLLDPTHIYVQAVEGCLDVNVDIHYAVNITGHGWRKLMRAKEPFAYIIEKLPIQLPIFDFIQEHGNVDEGEMYGNFNMGAGFALYVPESHVYKVMQVMTSLGYRAFRAGHIEKDDVKQVFIKPRCLLFGGETLAVR